MENYRQEKEEWEIEHLRKQTGYQLKESISKPDSTIHQVATMKQKSRSLQSCLHSYLQFLFLRIFSHNQDQKQS